MKKTYLLIIISLLLFGAALRIASTYQRPIHHDEISAEMIGGHLLKYGGYAYDPEFHGPMTFYIVALGISIFSDTEQGLRWIHVAISILTMIFILLLAKENHRASILILLVISPTILYYSNYAYFESLWLLLYGVWIISIVNLLFYNGKLYWLYIFFVTSVLMQATHEFSYALFVAGWITFEKVTHKKKITFIQMIKKKNMAAHIFTAAIISVIIFIGIWSVGFTQTETVQTSLVKSVTYNLHKSTAASGHDKPFYYYLKILVVLETFIAAMFLVFLIRTRSPEHYLLLVLALGSLIILSITRYKTPWGMMLILPPMIIAGAYGLEYALSIIKKHKAALLVMIILIATTATQLVLINFVYATNDEHNYLSYVQTKEDLWEMQQLIDSQDPQSILLIGSERQILTWVLRGHNVTLENQRPPTYEDVNSYDMVIADYGEYQIPFPSAQFTIRAGVEQIVYYHEEMQ